MQEYDHIARQFRQKEINSGIFIEGCIALAIAALVGVTYCSYTTKNSAKDTKVARVGIEEVIDGDGIVNRKKPWITIPEHERCLYLPELQEYTLNIGDKLKSVRWENTPEDKCDILKLER
jgi:hypothetical protein